MGDPTQYFSAGKTLIPMLSGPITDDMMLSFLYSVVSCVETGPVLGKVFIKFLTCSDRGGVVFRWTAIGWPQKILNEMEEVAAQHVEDEQSFHKIQMVDQNNFQERLDSLQVGLAEYWERVLVPWFPAFDFRFAT